MEAKFLSSGFAIPSKKSIDRSPLTAGRGERGTSPILQRTVFFVERRRHLCQSLVRRRLVLEGLTRSRVGRTRDRRRPQRAATSPYSLRRSFSRSAGHQLICRCIVAPPGESIHNAATDDVSLCLTKPSLNRRNKQTTCPDGLERR